MSTISDAARLLPPSTPANGLTEQRAVGTNGKIREYRLRQVIEQALPYVDSAVTVIANHLRERVTGLRTHLKSKAGARLADELEAAIAPAALALALREALRAPGSWAIVESPADDPRRIRDAQDARLFSIMAEEFLDLGLASARLGLDRRALEERAKRDPFFARAAEQAQLRGTAKLFGMVVELAREGNMKALALALTSRDPGRFVPIQRVEITERMIIESPSFQQVMKRLLDVLPPGHTCPTCGGCDCLSKAAAELGRG